MSTNDDDKRNDALSIRALLARFPIGKTKLHEEIRSGRLKARKLGTRTVILRPDYENWVASLPARYAREAR